MVPLPTIPCPLTSSTRDHSPSAPAESENDDQRQLQNKMSRAATRGKPTHTLPAHARSITTRRSQYPVGKKHVLRPQPQPAPLWPRAPANASIRTFAVVITESGEHKTTKGADVNTIQHSKMAPKSFRALARSEFRAPHRR